MTDNYRIDSHKLMFHPGRVADWLAGKVIYPLYAEISLSGACNHRCLFCALDYQGYVPRFQDTGMLMERISEMGRLGVKGIMFGGEGEPLLHREAGRIIAHTKMSGVDAALTTNGSMLTREISGTIVPHLSWIKVSVDAGTAETYSLLHGTTPDGFRKVFENISAAAELISKTGASCVLGLQAILLPENAGEMELLAALARDSGASYLVIKSYSQHPRSITRRYEEVRYDAENDLTERLNRFSGERFRVIVRTGSMHKLMDPERGYDRCLALPFWTYIDSGGTVWGCSAFLGDERFCLGSLYEQSFEEIWNGSRRLRLLETLSECFDISECRKNCRMDEVNRYLWELTHPGLHLNFI